MRDYEFKHAVEIIKQADALIIDGELVAPVLEEKTLTNDIKDYKVLEFFWGILAKCYQVRLSEDSTIKYDGQMFEIITPTNHRWTIIPLMKLKKWEDY